MLELRGGYFNYRVHGAACPASGTACQPCLPVDRHTYLFCGEGVGERERDIERWREGGTNIWLWVRMPGDG